jgi:uncharacterized protein
MHVTSRVRIFDAGGGKHFVCNALTGEVAVMSDGELEILEALRTGDASSCPPSFLDGLRRRRFVFPDPEAERAFFSELCEGAWSDFRRHSPRHYTFIVNTHCNFACSYCFEAAYDAPTMTLSPPQVDAAFRVIDRYAARRPGETPEIEVFGGEPLLPSSRPVLEHLFQRLAERGIRGSIQTNGWFLTTYLDFFVGHHEHIGQLQVTLDGPRQVHDGRRVPRDGRPSFDRIVAGIDALLAAGLPIRINIRMNVDRGNAAQLESMVRVYEEHGWLRDERVTFVAAPVDNRCGTLRREGGLLRWDEMFRRVFPLSTDTGGGPFDLSVFKVAGYFRHYLQSAASGEEPQFLPKVIYCEAAALKLLAFHPDGRLYPCPETVGMPHLAVGSYDPTLRIDRRRARPWRSQTILRRRRCGDCSISTFCGGGCVLTALMQNGTMAEPECEDAGDILEAYFGELGRAAR